MGSAYRIDDQPTAQAVVCNSGVANACTGAEGYSYCEQTAQVTAEELGIPVESVLVASTGVIGKQLPMDILKGGVKKLCRCFPRRKKLVLWRRSPL